MKLFKEFIPYIIILIVVVLIRTFLATPIMVQGTSMYDTLDGNEVMILVKVGDIKRYDIVVADYYKDGKMSEELIKRVYGMPGEKIKCEKGIVYINDKQADNSYATNTTNDFDEVTLGDDEYFLMGDNRSVSLDSRALGPFKRSQIQGTTDFIIWPLSKFGKVKQ